MDSTPNRSIATSSTTTLSTTTLVLHWIIAITIICMVSVGLYMTETETFFLYPYHKSIGVIIFSIILVRVAWRLKEGWPEPVSDYPIHERILSKLVHWVLLLASMAMPISGMIMSGAGGHGFGVFGWVIVAPNHDPVNPQKVLALYEPLANLAHEVHEIIGFVIAGAIILHIAGALKHHLMDKDRTLLRMLGR